MTTLPVAAIKEEIDLLDDKTILKKEEVDNPKSGYDLSIVKIEEYSDLNLSSGNAYEDTFNRELDTSGSTNNTDKCLDISGKEKLNCPYCPKKFSRKHLLVLHIRIHTGHKMFTCHHCLKKLATKNILRRHIRIIHNGECMFPCKYCPKFISMKKLEIHTRSHIGENLFPCTLCGKKLSSKSASLFLKRELRTNLDVFRPTQPPTIEKHSLETFNDPVLQEGEHVAVRSFTNPLHKWKKGTVVSKDGQLQYTVMVDGELHRKHVEHLRRTGGDWTPSLHIPPAPIATPPTVSQPPVNSAEETVSPVVPT